MLYIVCCKGGYGVIVGGVPCKIIGKFDDYKKRIEFIDNM